VFAGFLHFKTYLSPNNDLEIDDMVKALASEGEPLISGGGIVGNPDKGYKKSNTEQTNLLAEIECEK
jgi:spore germination protein KC